MNATDWDIVPPPGRIVAVGDVHGDLDALLRILIGTGLARADGAWIGAGCSLVLVGDLVDRGPDSVATMGYVMALQQQAGAGGNDGGRVDALLGNHELFVAQGDDLFMDPGEVAALADVWRGASRGLDAVFRGQSVWARWMRSRPTVLKIGDTVFVHAALDARALATPPAAINEGVRAWLAYYQGVAPAPDAATAWLVQMDWRGPLWSRALAARGSDPAPQAPHMKAQLSQVLAHLGAKRMVVGHTPTAHWTIAWPHPHFGELVAAIDTGISRYYGKLGGRLSALEIEGDVVRTRYFERGETELPATAALRARFAPTRGNR